MTKLNQTGTALIYSSFLGGRSADGGSADDAVVTVINAAGSELLFSSFLGGSAPDVASGIALDSAGNILLTGQTHSPDFPLTKDAQDSSFDGPSDAFVAKINLGSDAPPLIPVPSLPTKHLPALR